jgi:hypothetical protein
MSQSNSSEGWVGAGFLLRHQAWPLQRVARGLKRSKTQRFSALKETWVFHFNSWLLQKEELKHREVKGQAAQRPSSQRIVIFCLLGTWWGGIEGQFSTNASSFCCESLSSLAKRVRRNENSRSNCSNLFCFRDNARHLPLLRQEFTK